MESIDYGEAARRLYAGEMSFDEFVRRTSRTWDGVADRLMTKWGRLPAWLAREDLKQELLIEVWRGKAKYDPGRAAPGAYSKVGPRYAVAKRVHKARGVEQHRRRGPSRFELPCSEFADDSVTLGGGRQPTPEDEMIRAEMYRVLRALCETRRQRAVVIALERSGGAARVASTTLWEDRAARLACRLVNERHASATIKEVVDELTARFGIEEART